MMMRYDRGRDSVNVTTGAFSQRDTSGRHVRRGKSRGRERQRLRFVFILTGRSRGVFTRSPWEDTAGLPAPQTPHEDDEEGGAQKERWRKVTSGTTQKEGGLPSLQGRVKRELQPVNRRSRRSHSQSNCEGFLRYDQAQVAAEEQARREAAREAFQGTWLRSTEKDLKRCCERYQASDDSSESSTLKAYIHTYRQTQGPSRVSGDVWNCRGSSARQPHPSARSDRTTNTDASKRKRFSSSQRVTKNIAKATK